MSAKLPQATTPRIKAFPYYTFVVYVPPSQFRYDPVPFLLTQSQLDPFSSTFTTLTPDISPSTSVRPVHCPNSRTHPPHRSEWRATSSAPVPSETPSGWPQAMLPSLRAEVPAEVVSSYPSYCSPWCAASGSAGPLRDSKRLAAGDAATTRSLLKSCRRIHRTAPRGARRPAALVPSETPSGWPQAMLPPLRGRGSLLKSCRRIHRTAPWCAASGSAGPLRDSEWLAAGDAATTQRPKPGAMKSRRRSTGPVLSSSNLLVLRSGISVLCWTVPDPSSYRTPSKQPQAVLLPTWCRV